MPHYDVASEIGRYLDKETTRHFDRKINEDIPKPRMSSKKRIKRGGRPKPFIEIISGEQLDRDSGKWIDKIRVIDQEKDLYKEKVVDPDTDTEESFTT